MNSTVRNILAVILGLVVGSIVNMGLIQVSGSVIPAPDGTDVTTMEGLKEALPLFQPKHFIFPFLAHALGTLVGAVVAAMVAATNKKKMALIVGVFFLIGGIINLFMLPSPTWFAILDVVGAYIPMAWIGGILGTKRTE